MRDRLLRTAVALGAIAVLLTEALGAMHLLRPLPLAIAWILTAAVFALRFRPALHLPAARLSRFEWFALASCGAIVAVVAVTALLSPPNSADAMAYHLPRVIYWAQNASVSFFPTPYYNQVMLPPAAEYLMLHTYLLTGGDHFVNLLTCAAFALGIVAVSAIARELGLPHRAQAIAAIFCATLPDAILQASGAKNDTLLSLWIACAVWSALRRDLLVLGLAAGLALATKSTAWLFLPPLLLAAGVRRRREFAAITAGILLLNGPQFVRNLRLSGSPIGFDSAHGDHVYRWRNESLSWRPLASNFLRHTSEQLGARSDRWNQSVYRTVLAVHQALGLDPNDPATTWPGATFGPPINANHEANANNRWHLVLALAAGIWAILRRDRSIAAYAAGLCAAFLLFCFYLKWQPFLARLELPLFMLAAPLAAWLVGRFRPPWLGLLLCLFLLNSARPALFQNWTRPLKGPDSLWHSRRQDDYFRDMVQWNNRPSYLEAVDRVAHSGCTLIGIDITENQLEYPFQALLRERRPEVRFTHPESGARACAVLCLDCIGNQQKIARYAPVGTPIAIGRFLLFE